MEHDGTDAPQVFPEVRWIMVNPRGFNGAVVQMTCAPFVHSELPDQHVNTRLDMRIIRTDRRSQWRVIVPSGESQTNGRSRPASVTAASSNRGNGELGIVVSFLSGDLSDVAAGEYETTLIGTITAD